jgi:hypothetical protein
MLERRLHALTIVGLVSVSGATRAEDSPYCRRVRAQAAADAMVMRSPRLFLEGIRFPSSNRLDLGPTVGNNFQGRVGLAFSPLDWLRGGLVREAADADCATHEAATRVEDLLPWIDDAVRAGALRSQAAFLDAHQGEWRALLARASKRFEARVITRVELHELRALADALDRKLVQARSEAARLDPGDAPPMPLSLAGLAEGYLGNAATLDGTVAKLRGLDAWSFKVSGGVIPLPGQPLDWFGIAEVAYSLGGPFEAREQARAVAAHGEELRQSRRELPAKLDRARRDIAARISGAKEELAVIDGQLAAASEASRALDAADTAGIDQARDTLAMERLSVESERVLLSGLLERLQILAGGANGS